MARFIGDIDDLRKLPPLAWFSDSQLSWLLPRLERRYYPARDVMERAGEPGTGLYILLKGEASLIHEDGRGHELCVSRLRAPTFFGETALVERHSCATTVRAVQPCDILFVPHAAMRSCVQDNAQAALKMLEVVTTRLCETHQKLAQIALASVDERVAAVLLEYSAAQARDLPVPLGSEQISSLVGSSREMVSRVLKNMIEAGLLTRQRRKLVVLDREGLLRRAGRASDGRAQSTHECAEQH